MAVVTSTAIESTSTPTIVRTGHPSALIANPELLSPSHVLSLIEASLPHRPLTLFEFLLLWIIIVVMAWVSWKMMRIAVDILLSQNGDDASASGYSNRDASDEGSRRMQRSRPSPLSREHSDYYDLEAQSPRPRMQQTPRYHNPFSPEPDSAASIKGFAQDYEILRESGNDIQAALSLCGERSTPSTPFTPLRMRGGRSAWGRVSANDEKWTYALGSEQYSSTKNVQREKHYVHGLGITDDSSSRELVDDVERHEDGKKKIDAEDVPDQVTRSQGAMTSGDNTPAWETQGRRQSATKASITERWETDLTRYFFDDGVGVKRYLTSGPVMGEKIE